VAIEWDTNITRELPLAREQFGFRRTVCGCELCRAPCRHMPGSLDISDLPRLCPAGQDVLAWAEEHLRALTDKPFPTLVPARQANGHCHWLYEGKCAVHEVSPYGCAFFDSHLDGAEVKRRAAATMQARRADRVNNGLYYQVWRHLCARGLTAPSGDRASLAEERRKIRRDAERRF
jgi:Fe-S-cluster containining protein